MDNEINDDECVNDYPLDDFGDFEYAKAKVSICWMKEKYNNDKLYTYTVDGDTNLYDYVIINFKDRLDIGEIEEISDTYFSPKKSGKTYAIGKSYSTYIDAKFALKELQEKEAEKWWEELGKSKKREDKQRYTSYKAFNLEKTDVEKSIEMYESLLAENYNLSTTPYNRLVILYKKKKQLNEVIKVIEKAICAFENIPFTRDRFITLLEKYKK